MIRHKRERQKRQVERERERERENERERVRETVRVKEILITQNALFDLQDDLGGQSHKSKPFLDKLYKFLEIFHSIFSLIQFI